MTSQAAERGIIQLTTAAQTSSEPTTVQTTTAAVTTAAPTTAAATTKAQETTKAHPETKIVTYYTYEEAESSESSKQNSASSKSSASSSADASASYSDSDASASYSDSDAAVVHKGVTIKIDGEFNSSKLGTPDSKQENNNCLTGGSGYAYVYGAMTVNVYISGGKEYAEGILVDGSDSVSTSEGITYGSSTSDLKKAYGTPGSQDSGMYMYSSSNTSVMFYLNDNSVTGMYISKNV